MLNSRAENFLINDPVPKNVSKYPIHQTYLTDDAEQTAIGGYKFKAPEVWSSARSGKKSIAIRSIQWLPKTITLEFSISIETAAASGSTPATYEDGFNYHNVIPPNATLYDIIADVIDKFKAWTHADQNNIKDFILTYDYENRSNSFFFMMYNRAGTTKYKIRFTDPVSKTEPPDQFNILLNQPMTYFPDYQEIVYYSNVWDRTTALNFHASFVPFDNYQNLGTIFDKCQTPIIYQDPNSSPLFNVWITTDMKKPLKLLYESFLIRMTFIISSESQYQ